jgi:hypothetical protein
MANLNCEGTEVYNGFISASDGVISFEPMLSFNESKELSASLLSA